MELLARHALFPAVGVPIHVNRPQHDGHTPLHQHDFLEIALVVDGKALHRTLHGVATVHPGDVFLLKPGDWHAYERCQGLRLANCNIGLDLLAGPLAWLRDDALLGPLLAAPPEVRLPPDSVERSLGILDRIMELQRDAPERRRVDLIGQLLLYLAELGRGMVVGRGRTMTPHPAVDQVVALLSADLARAWSLDHLAASVELDRSYLVRLFRRHTSLSPITWLARARGERAAILLLTTERTVADIGAEVGWPDPNYFGRRFRSLFRQTPSDYRKQLPVKPAEMHAADWIQW
jgi:AraC family L-rhamnose operon transcriptional activator RhaR